MLDTLQELSASWKMIRLGAFTVGLRIKSPLDRETAMKGLAKVASAFPSLSESKYVDDKQAFILLNGEIEGEKQALFRMEGLRTFDFAWGALAEFDIDRDGKRLFELFQNEFGVQAINVEYIDFKVYLISDWDGHHPRAIVSALFKDSPISMLYSSQRVLGSELVFRGMLDAHRVAVVGVETDVADSEVMKGYFKDDKLRASLGVAQRGGLALDARLSDVFMQHAEVALRFMTDKFIPQVVQPLDQALHDLSRSKG